MKFFKSILKIVMLVITIHFHVSTSAQINAAKDVHDQAISDYTESLRLDPKYISAWNNRGESAE